MRVNPPRNGTFWQYVMRRTKDPDKTPLNIFINGLLKYRRRFTESSLAEHLFEENMPKSDIALYIQIVKDWQDYKARRYRAKWMRARANVMETSVMREEERLERRKFRLEELRRRAEELINQEGMSQ